LFLDNKESGNLKQEMIDFLLFLATGGDPGRATRSGGLRRAPCGRPIAALTSIEGFDAVELCSRSVEFEFRSPEGRAGTFSEMEVTRKLRDNRDLIWCGLTHLMQRYLQNLEDGDLEPIPIPVAVKRFGDNWRTICRLLRAYGDVSERGAAWADDIIATWGEALSTSEAGNEELSMIVRKFLDAHITQARVRKLDEEFYAEPKEGKKLALPACEAAIATYKGQEGTLYVTQCATILPPQQVGTSSSAQPITISNGSTTTISISRIIVSGTNAKDFSQSNTCGTELPPGSSCTISVTFTPKKTGARSAAVDITDDAGGSPQSIPLSDTGT
jgi:hypothetical protein